MLTELTTQDFEPAMGLIVFKRHGEYYLQSHSIHKTKEGFVWGEGTPTDLEDIGEIAATLQSKEDRSVKATGLLPTNLLYFNPSHSGATIVWYNKPTKRNLTFGPKIKLKDGLYNMPGLIFFAKDNSLQVFAFAGAGKPGLKTKIFKGPFYNMHDNGAVCMGTTIESRAKRDLKEEMERHERRFFGSRFTHTLCQEVISKKYTLNKLYTKIARTKFPTDALIETGEYKNLQELIKQVAK